MTVLGDTQADATHAPAQDATQNGEPVRRTREIEEATNLYVIHPLANRLAVWLSRTRIPANAVSLTGMACGLAAGFAYYHDRDWRFAVLGFALMIAWHVMDGADGQLARLTQTQSETGRILDGICDYVTFIAVYVALALQLSRHHGPLIWLLVTAAGLCHAVQAGAYEVQRQEYEFWGCGRDSKNILATAAAPSGTRSGVLALLAAFYEKIQFVAIGPTLAFHARLAALHASMPDQAESLRAAYRAAFAPSVRRWALLSANYRTCAIFVFVVLKIPACYFVFEIVGLGATMALLTWRQTATQKTYLATLNRQAG